MAEAGSDKWQIGIAVGGPRVCRTRVTRGRCERLKMTRSRIAAADEAEGILLACRILPHSNLAAAPRPIRARQAAA